MATHRINRVEFELEVSAVELGRRLSDRVSVLGSQRIPSVIDVVCSEADDSDVVVERIDTLELDLGRISLENFDDDLLGKLEAALREALRARSRSAGTVGPSAPADAETSLTSSPPGRAGDARELLDGHAWTGNLPWWADTRERDLLALHIKHLLAHAPESWLELLREHADDRVGLARLARICDERLFELVLERSGAGSARADLHSLSGLLALVGVPSHRVRASVLGALGLHGSLEPADLLAAVLRELESEVVEGLAAKIVEQPELGTAAVRDAIARASARAGERAAAARINPVSSTARTMSEPGDTSHDDPDPPQTRADARPEPASPSRFPRPAQLEPPKLQLARRRALARLDELYIDDAGLVILWPFLERLFTRVELLEKPSFRDELAQTKAIALLAYLGLEDPEPREHRLSFAKLLCGRSPEQPCILDAALEPELREECETLLAAVIDHAPVLDAMPIPQFRASFLQRAGVLSVRTGSWLLAVERQPYDLVLDRFSWSWAWIKLPWMPQPVTVEW